MITTHLFYIPLVFILGMAAGYYLARSLKRADQADSLSQEERLKRRQAEREKLLGQPDSHDGNG